MVPSKVPAGPVGTTMGDIGTSLYPWLKFCVAANDGGEVNSPVGAVGVAASVVQQL
jgi:hypothetical protein